MMTSSIPREYARQYIPVVSGTGFCVVNLIGYLDAMIIDAPGSETYTFSIKGPLGVEYYIVPVSLTGDTTWTFPSRIPMTGKMTFTIIGASGDGAFSIVPIGNLM